MLDLNQSHKVALIIAKSSARFLTPFLGPAMLRCTKCNVGVLPMRDFHEILAPLQAFRAKFEHLLAAARKKAAHARGAPARRPARMRELTGFGANPGNLRMFAYAPEDLPPQAPLVVALHGCTQTSSDYAGRRSPKGSASRSSIRSSSPPTIPRIVSPGSCRATSRAVRARHVRSGRWSSTPLRHLLPTAAKYS